MATSATTYFGNRARAAIITTDGTTHGTPVLADVFTVTRGFETTFEWENHELYGTDSIFRVDEAKSQFKATTKLKGCKFNPDIAGHVGIMDKLLRTLNPTSFDGTILDSNALQLFDVWIYQTGSSTPVDNKFCVKTISGYMESVPIPFTENDYIILDLTFKGRTGAITNVAVPTS